MKRRIPLNPIRAFETAARHMSVARAAEELCLTPTAISHHVRMLEDYLQVKLFERKNGRLILTAHAEEVLPLLTKGFESIESAIDQLMREEKRERLVIASPPSFTQIWLLPRLRKFTEQVSGIDVVLTGAKSRANVVEDRVDLAIAYGHSGSDQRIETLMDEELVPVASPTLVEEAGGREQALRTLPFIHDDKGPRPAGQYVTWKDYMSMFCQTNQDTSSGLRFSLSSLAIEAAIKGHGMLLGRSRLVEDYVKAGDLEPIGPAHPTKFEYYMLSRTETSSAASAFREWLIEEAQRPVEFAA